ncbi:MAG: SRPBCC family protein [Pseudomonadota bacterium]
MNYENALGIEFRETRDVVHNGGEARCVSGTREYPTDIDDLWDAVTNPERIPRWFLPISGDLQPRGRYQLEGHAGGDIIECDPPHRFYATWEYGGDVSWITVTLKAGAAGTTLTLEHIMPRDEKNEEHWGKYGPAATGVGWELAFLALDYILANPGAVIDAKENEAWMTSAAGKAFMRDSARQWGDAHIAAGKDPDAARAMADHTAGFYTGE